MPEWKAGKIYKIELYKHKGYIALNEKHAGIFGYRDTGDYKGASYDKARLYEVYKPMTSPKLRFARRKLGSYDLGKKTSFSNIGIQPTLIPLAIEILSKIYTEITGNIVLSKLEPTHKQTPVPKEQAQRKPSAQELAKRIGI